MAVFNIDDLIARSFTFHWENTDWIMTELSVGDRAELGAVLRTVVPNPLTEAKAALPSLSPASAAAVWKEASRQYAYWPPTIESEEGQNLLFTSRPVQEAVLLHALRRRQVVAPETVRRMIDSMPFAAALLPLMLFALTGNAPGDNDPKGELSNLQTGTK